MSPLFILLEAVVDVAHEWMKLGAGFAAVIAVFGASWGISRIAKTALEGMARQPEAGNDLRSAMIVSAALIEGVTFFAILVCLLILFI